MGLLPLLPIAEGHHWLKKGSWRRKHSGIVGRSPPWSPRELVEQFFTCCKVGAPKSMPVHQVLIPCCTWFPTTQFCLCCWTFAVSSIKHGKCSCLKGTFWHIWTWDLPVSVTEWMVRAQTRPICLCSVDQIAGALPHIDTSFRILSESEILQKWRWMSVFKILWGSSRCQWWLELMFPFIQYLITYLVSGDPDLILSLLRIFKPPFLLS